MGSCAGKCILVFWRVCYCGWLHMCCVWAVHDLVWVCVSLCESA